ncbi:peptidylprolyl isomerase [Mangrovimicrobium sediminis]|uniref:Peptidylprolyl isomerase n=1 Tax=Mangrovimicrobium sediminis TaxID=2562682 RepID=A0A4Z0M6C0_9GAMM|nr:fatty acid cis/trans isomerase [Haliea sp. SAOS-164]TGD74855.1 peptidylprolyl isomerase [Haliea sp. SAOS-164]
MSRPLLTLLLVLGTAALPRPALTQESLAVRAAGVIEQRCMVCHGCYDAPCQLKLEARGGLERGASKALVYDAARLLDADMTRLFLDAHSEEKWRKKGFYPVLDPNQPELGLMHRMLALKQAHPLPVSAPLPEGFDFALDREQQCPKPDEFDRFASEYPYWGMPYGLPGLEPAEHSTLNDWLQAGAPAVPLPDLEPELLRAIERWEGFLNAADNKSRLMARYLYEHLFLASLYFGDAGQPAWFRLVRSKTPPGEPLKVIATRRPFDAPGSDIFYYRFMRLPVTPLAKIHMPYRLDDKRMARYRELFLAPDYAVETLPGYEPALASNPFKTFEAIPANLRYHFLLDEARFTIMNFIKGPVCRGRVALNVIEDRFWVMFANPDIIDIEQDEAFLSREADNLQLPTVRTGTAIDLVAWRRYSKKVKVYTDARAKYIHDELAGRVKRRDAHPIWDGDGVNDNAALTIFRHFDSASVEKGFIGTTPKTAWVISYPLLERIHYLLVANYDVYGAVSHQLVSRLYMDFLRMEGESNFLMFMPAGEREALWRHWYRDAPSSVTDYLEEHYAVTAKDLGIEYQTDDPKVEFLEAMRGHIYGAKNPRWDYHGVAGETTSVLFDDLVADVGVHNSFLPQVIYVNVVGPRRDEVYTIMRDAGYSNIAQLFDEAERRLPQEDSLTIVPGFLGAYPNYFFMVNEAELPRFAAAVAALDSEHAYYRLQQRWGVGRSDPWFWRVSDKFHAMIKRDGDVGAGLLDYNRYQSGSKPRDVPE